MISRKFSKITILILLAIVVIFSFVILFCFFNPKNKKNTRCAFYTRKTSGISSGFLGVMETLTPKHPFLKEKSLLDSLGNHIQQNTDISILFHIDPSLLRFSHIHFSSLSGELILQSTRNTFRTELIDQFTLSGSLTVYGQFEVIGSGLNSQTIPTNDLAQEKISDHKQQIKKNKKQNFIRNFAFSLTGSIIDNTIFIQLNNVSQKQQGRNNEQVKLWYLLIQEYKYKLIAFENVKDPMLSTLLLSPNSLERILHYTKKHRVIPHTGSGYTRILSGSSLVRSGYFLNTTNRKHSLLFTDHQLSLIQTSTTLPDVYDIMILQNNDYKGIFQGVQRKKRKAKKLQQYITGSLMLPNGINASISLITKKQKRHKKKNIDLATIHNNQYITRKELISGRRFVLQSGSQEKN